MPRLLARDMSPEQQAEFKAKIEERRAIHSILTEAARYFHQNLIEDDGLTAHLVNHYGLTEETVEAYSLGYSTGSGLERHLRDLGYSVPQITGSGLEAILELESESEIENGLLEAKKIVERINEGQPEKFKTTQSSITRTCKSMGFHSSRPGGRTHIQIDPDLLRKLTTRYLRKSAQSALSAQDQPNHALGLCIFDADHPDGSEKAPEQVHGVSHGNADGCADRADCAQIQSVETDPHPATHEEERIKI